MNYDNYKHEKQMALCRGAAQDLQKCFEKYSQLNLIRKVNFDAGTLDIMMSEVFRGSMIPKGQSNR